MLEDSEHAKRRGAKIYAEVQGYGMSGDGHHITAPSPDGSGAIRAMKGALRDGGSDAKSVDYVNAHATSTMLGDRVENLAIQVSFLCFNDINFPCSCLSVSLARWPKSLTSTSASGDLRSLLSYRPRRYCERMSSSAPPKGQLAICLELLVRSKLPSQSWH